VHAALLVLAVLSQRTESFTLALDAPVAEALPLFGPVREAEWSPDWAAAQRPHWEAAIRSALARRGHAGGQEDR